MKNLIKYSPIVILAIILINQILIKNHTALIEISLLTLFVFSVALTRKVYPTPDFNMVLKLKSWPFIVSMIITFIIAIVQLKFN
jgi:branched-subunit amino acid transport protein